MQEIVFVGSRRSQAANARKLLWGGLAAAVVFSFARTGFSRPAFVIWGLLLAFFFVVDWRFMRRMGTGRPVALLDDTGIASPLFTTRAKRFAWDEIAEARLVAPQGHRALQLVLQPRAGRKDKRAFWTGVNHARPQLALTALEAGEQERLVQAVLERIGAASGDTVPQVVNELRQERVFNEKLRTLAPTPWLTWILVGLNVAVWLAMAARGANGMQADTRTLLDWGANSAYEVVARGQWWRLLTAAFLHGGLMHLVMNMVGLASAGPTVERLYGRRQFALVYFGAALAGGALSLHFAAEKAVSVGASGAVFGVFAAMLVGLHGHRKDLPKAFTRQTLGGLAFFVAYSLLQGFARTGIDNSAHVGGLLAGGVLAWLLPRQLDADLFRRRFAHRAAIGVALVPLVVGGLTLTARPGTDQRLYFSSVESLQEGLQLVEAAYKALQRDQEALKKGELTEIALDERGRTVHAPNFRRARVALERVHLPPDDPRVRLATDTLRATRLLEEMLAMQSNIVDGKPVPVDPVRFEAAEKETVELGQRIQAEVERLKKLAARR